MEISTSSTEVTVTGSSMSWKAVLETVREVQENDRQQGYVVSFRKIVDKEIYMWEMTVTWVMDSGGLVAAPLVGVCGYSQWLSDNCTFFGVKSAFSHAFLRQKVRPKLVHQSWPTYNSPLLWSVSLQRDGFSVSYVKNVNRDKQKLFFFV